MHCFGDTAIAIDLRYQTGLGASCRPDMPPTKNARERARTAVDLVTWGLGGLELGSHRTLVARFSDSLSVNPVNSTCPKSRTARRSTRDSSINTSGIRSSRSGTSLLHQFGKVKLLGFVMHGCMGSYNEATALRFRPARRRTSAPCARAIQNSGLSSTWSSRSSTISVRSPAPAGRRGDTKPSSLDLNTHPY